MVSYKKTGTSSLLLISGLLALAFLYGTLMIYVNFIHGKPNLVSVIVLLLTNIVFVGGALILGLTHSFADLTRKRILIAAMIISFLPTTYFGYMMYENLIEWSFTPEKWQSRQTLPLLMWQSQGIPT